MMLRTTLCGAFVLLLLLGNPATANPEARSLQVRSLAASCASCHGTQGRAIDGAAVPGLAGMPAAYMVEQMKAFKSGARTATVMHQLAKGFSEAQIEQLAAHFSSIGATPAKN